MKKLALLLVCAFSFLNFLSSQAQVMDPNDPVITYNPNNPPATPPNNGQVYDWVRTVRVNWGADSYKAYYYNAMAFRLKFPSNYDASGNTKYPMIIMLHGLGERGTIYDNEFSMRHGGKQHKDAVDNGEFNGFIMYPQNTQGTWGGNYRANINSLIVNHFESINVDLNRIGVHGLSAGGTGAWYMLKEFPKTFAAGAPMSASPQLYDDVNLFKHIPIWISQGGLDGNPSPSRTQRLVDAVWEVNGSLKYTIYQNLGHGVWNTHYAENDFFPFFSRANKTNPTILEGEPILVLNENNKEVYEFFTRNEFCPGETVITRLGLTAGFDNYQWRKDGNIIAGATSNEYVVTNFGTYDARFMRNGVWTDWSTNPVSVSLKQATQTPPIEVAGLESIVLPAPDGSTSVNLQVPAGYEAYTWRKVGTSQILSTTRSLEATSVGQYEVTVTEKFGCSSNYSAPFTVIDAAGSNSPDSPLDFAGFALSNTSLQIQWSQNPNPLNNENGFEIYRKIDSDNEFALIAITNADVSSFLDENLLANTNYDYIIRAVNNNGASSDAITNVTTFVDTTPPTVPTNLQIINSSENSVTLTWDPSTDDVGVYKYDIYRDGLKALTVNNNEATVYNLQGERAYRFYIKARDLTGNLSAASSQVIAVTVASGLYYSYYEGTWNNLPDFSSLTPVKTGKSDNVDISIREQNDNFAFMWQGNINIPVAGNYTFETNSDDGSKLYIGGYDESNLVVNNDGLHGSRYREGTYNFPSAGSYPIVITFFEKGGGESMQVYWKNTAHGVNTRQLIPDGAFKDDFVFPGNPPSAPGNITASALSHNQIQVNWTDLSANETEFQVYRNANSSEFHPVGIVSAGTESFIDNGLNPNTEYGYQVVALGQYGTSGTPVSPKELLGDINSGVGAQDNATGTGWLLYTEQSVFERFSPTPHSNNTDHVIAVRYNAGQWEYDNNGGYYNFTPLESDILLASVDFSNDQIQSFEGMNQTINGIHAGFENIDLTFIADWWNGGSNNGEFTVNGTQFNRNNVEAAYAFTLALPPLPQNPEELSATATSTSGIELTWTDSDDVETGFKVYRSTNTGNNYILIDTVASLDGGMATYENNTLLAHTTYFYKVVAFNAAGDADGITTSVSTLNDAPELSPDIEVLSINYSIPSEINFFADDANDDIVTLNGINLPSFATFTDYGDGSGLLTFEPNESDIGIYEGVVIEATDGFGGVTHQTFTVDVNTNFNPTITPINDITISEEDTATISITGSDLNVEQVLTWEISPSLPFITTTYNIENEITLVVNPSYADGGEYQITINLDDNAGGIATEEFLLTINEVNPNTTNLVNFTDGNLIQGANWNNTSGYPSQGSQYSNLTGNNGEVTGVGIEFISNWGNWSNELGMNTGNNSGVYPDNVIKSAYYTRGNAEQINVFGLDPDQNYTLTFFGSREATDDRTTIYSVGGQSISLNAASNIQNVAQLVDLTPSPSGEITFSIEKGGVSAYGYLNALEIKKNFDDGTLPVKPSEFSVAYHNENNQIEIEWNDRAYNELGYELEKAESAMGPFSLLYTSDVNENSFADQATSANDTYYYRLRAFNAYGYSDYTDVLNISIPNIAPVIDDIEPIVANIGETTTVNVTATDDPSDVINLFIQNNPSFVTFNDLGNGDGELIISPTQDINIGNYSINLVASDDKGESSNYSLEFQVVNPNLQKLFVNFTGRPAYVQNSPWNNLEGSGTAGSSLQNLLDDNGEASGISMTLLDNWNGSNELGMSTGNDSGLYPDNVMLSALWETNTTNRIVFSGLSSNRVYTIQCFGSRDGGGNRNSEYSVNNVSESLNASFNVSETATLSGLIPDQNGEIILSVSRGAGSSYAYLNAIVIESSPAAEIPNTPTDLVAQGISKSEISLEWTDNAISEMNYQVYRSETQLGSYQLIATIPADSRTFVDQGLQSGDHFYYKVRAAFDEEEFTDFSTVSSAYTVLQEIGINFTRDVLAVSPWNNMTTFSGGAELTNLQDDLNNNTGISIEIVENNPDYDIGLFGFNGDNPFGMSTGNNSGAVPDDVMGYSYWLDPNKVAQLNLSNLDISLGYNFIFFASRDGGGDRNTDYTIGNETVTLNAAYNIQETVQLNGVVADGNGEILITIATSQGASYGYINGIIIQTYPVDGKTQTASARIGGDTTEEFNESSLNLYPNPFVDQVNVKLNIQEETNLFITLRDLQGRLVYEKHLDQIKVGRSLFNLNLNQLKSNSNLYLLEIYGDKFEKQIMRVMRK